jgi:hypothetical protein
MDLASVSCRLITLFPATFVEEAVFSPSYIFGTFVKKKKKKGEHSCVGSYPGPLFCSTGLHVRFCVSTLMFLLLLLCNIV